MATGVALLGTAAALFAGTAAFADPIDSDGDYINGRALNGTGSDTIQDVMNGLSAVVENSDEDLVIGSWDATVPSGQGNFIVTHTGGRSIPRPNGSGQGLSALKAAWNNTSLTNARGTSSGNLDHTDLQFSRSSSGPSTTSLTGTYSYVPLAVDAVSYAVNEENETLPRDLTLAQLTDIYSADNGDTITIGATTYTIGDETYSGATLTPFIPQAGSGTRSFWLSALGLTETTKGSAVQDDFDFSAPFACAEVDADGDCLVQEHNGAVLSEVDNAIVPFSIAQYIAQTKVAATPTHYTSAYGVTVLDRRGAAELGEIGNVSPLSGTTLNTLFPVKRAVFNVVPFAAVDSTSVDYNETLDDAFGNGGAIYTATRPGTSTLVIQDFGFGSLGTSGVTINGKLYQAGDVNSFRTNG